MARTISGSSSSGITLTSGDNPVSVTGTIAPVGGTALYGPGTDSYSWTIDNSGMVSGGTSPGIQLGSASAAVGPSAVTNENGGLISGNYAVYIYGPGSVTNLSSGTISGSGNGVQISGALGTVVNAGTVYGGSFGVREVGGSVTNLSSGVITGIENGVQFAATGSVVNAGTIAGSVQEGSGGSVTNLASGSISAGVYIFGAAAGSVVNAGTISGSVQEASGGSVTNLASGNISAGVYIFGAAGTITNAGTVSTVQLGVQSAHNLVIVDPGAVFAGSIDGGGGTLELASAASVGTLSGIGGSSITDFGSLEFDRGARWTISGDSSADGLGTIGITGFVAGDTIDLTGVTANRGTYDDDDGQLILTNDAAPVATLHMAGVFTTADFGISNDGSDTTITTDAACYRAGTHILTPSGEVPVEELAIRDLVVTRSGEAKPIKWIGRRSYAGRMIAGNREILPIRIAAGALAEGVPSRDLDVSPGHAFLFDEGWVASERLVNGISIRQLEAVDSVEYIHIELDAHDAVFAEGAIAETYVECDNRGRFQNGHEFEQLYPGVDAPKWADRAPRIEGGAELASVRLKLDNRLEACGHARSFDPALRLVVDGRELLPDVVRGDDYLFRVAKQPTDVRIVSHSSIPAGTNGSTDRRRLGVNLSCLILRGASATLMVEHNDPSLIEGFHHAEARHRWTDGNARIPRAFLACFPQNLTIEVRTLGRGLPYRIGHWGSTAQESVASRELGANGAAQVAS